MGSWQSKKAAFPPLAAVSTKPDVVVRYTQSFKGPGCLGAARCGLVLLVALTVYSRGYGDSQAMEKIAWGGFLLKLIYKLWVAWEAGQCFAEDRRTSALETFVGTALSVREIVWGRFHALVHLFAGPMFAMILVEAGGLLVVQLTSEAERLEGKGFLAAWNWETFVLLVFAANVVWFVDCFAMGWIAMWSGLKSRNPLRGLLSAIWRILLLSWLPFGLFMGILSSEVATAPGAANLPLCISYILASLVVAIPCFDSARDELYRFFGVLSLHPEGVSEKVYRQEARMNIRQADQRKAELRPQA